MGRLVDAIASPTTPLVWLDSDAYASRLFATLPPWLDVAGLVGWRRKAQGLLRSDVVTLPIEDVCSVWLEANITLAQEMLMKQRNLYPLKTLLADSALRAHLAGLARAIRQSFSELPLVLVTPSPRAWIGAAHAAVHATGDAIEVDDDDADSAAVYVADFLRTFADCHIDALLLDETRVTQPASSASLAPYQAVLNVAAHYRWDVGMKLAMPSSSELASAGVSFVISPEPSDVISGTSVDAFFWSGHAPSPRPSKGFRHADIPAALSPEVALERVAVLRAAG